MTLIEVMVALVILGTLLVCAVVARGRYLRQSAIAQRKLNAIAAADSLLAQWWLDPQKVPRAASGEVPGVQKLTWQSQTLDRDDAEALGAQVLNLQIFDGRTNVAVHGTIGNSQTPLVSVELLVPTEKPGSTAVGNGSRQEAANAQE
jgi:prepilin-type N-terminal cleavage/methylation domain-containing protein